MPTAMLTELLDREGVRYITIQHSRAYTAQEVAAAAHVSGKEMAKTVVTKLDGKPALVVLPAGEKVNFDQLRANTGAHEVELATEQEFATLFPECELGAMPPFGNLYGLETYVTQSLADDEEIAFNAGTLTELVRMPRALRIRQLARSRMAVQRVRRACAAALGLRSRVNTPFLFPSTRKMPALVWKSAKFQTCSPTTASQASKTRWFMSRYSTWYSSLHG